jgi:esterase/lipase superfamily enzyme
MLSDLAPIFSNILIGAVAILLVVLFWRSTSGGKAGDTAVMRFALLFLLAPFVAAAVLGSIPHQIPGGPSAGAGQKPDTASAPRSATAPVGAPAPKAAPAPAPTSAGPAKAPAAPPRQEAAAPPPSTATPPAAPITRTPEPAAPPPAAPPAASSSPPPAPAPPAGEKKSAVGEAIEQLAKQSAASPSPPPVAAPARPTAEEEAKAKEPWDVVPVYYGTDRSADTSGTRLSYGAERARRLELGRALVTVPKSHEVPNVERPWVYRLPFSNVILLQEKEDPSKHFTVQEIKTMSREELAQIVRDRLGASSDFKDQALVFLHGFNNAFDSALFRTAQIAYDLKFDGAPFMYSWPSKGQLGLQDYSYDRESSTQAEPYLRQFLEFVTRETGAKSVNIIAHSMGNQVLLNVLRELKRLKPADVHIGEIILAAPDVDRDTFEFLAKEISGLGRGITVLASSNDRALEASKRFWGGVPRAGDMAGGTPVLVAGIDTIDISALSTDFLSLNHSSYAEHRQLLGDLRSLLKDGARPTQKREPPLDRVSTDKGTYWRYPAAN